MMVKNKSTKARTVVLDGFSGIDRSSPFGAKRNKSALTMTNFRLCDDGSIEKRCGIRHCLTLPAALRAVYSRQGDETVFAAIANGLYSLNPATGACTRLCGLESSEGDVGIFRYDGDTYVLDGASLKKYSSQTLTEVNGYVPLYGKDWHPVNRGAVYEPLNLLSQSIRIMYEVGDTMPQVFHFGLRASSVEGVEADGSYYSSAYCELTGDGKGFSFTENVTNCKLTVRITVSTDVYDRSELLTCTRAVVYGGVGNSRVFCYGGSDPSRLCCSKQISDEAFRQCALFYPNNSRLYFPFDNCNRIGDGHSPINALCRHYDRLLIFTSDETWMADCDISATSPVKIIPVNSAVGCNVKDGAVLCGDTPLSLCTRGVFRWSSDTYTRTESSAVCVSAPVSEFLDADYLENAVICACPDGKEAAVYSRTSAEDVIWFYNIKHDSWYTVDGASAYDMFVYQDSLCFVDGLQIYITDMSEYVDTDENGEESEIEAGFVSNYLDFSSDGDITQSRFRGCSVLANTYGGELTVGYFADNGSQGSFEFSGRMTSAPESFSVRGSSPRFGFARVTVCADGEERQHIYRLALDIG